MTTKKDDCLFCKIAAGQIPSTKIYSDERVYAFSDINPEAPVHVLVIPREHYDSLLAVPSGDDIQHHILDVIQKIAVDKGIEQDGFRVVTNVGSNGGQTVNHLHFHLLGGRALTWPPG